MKNIFVFIVFLSIVSCQQNNEEIEYSIPTPEGLVHWNISNVEGNNVIEVNDTLILNVYCPMSSSCDIVTQLLSDYYGNLILVKAFGYTVNNSPCLSYAVPQLIEYKFISDTEGIYILEFINRDNSVIEYTIEVK